MQTRKHLTPEAKNAIKVKLNMGYTVSELAQEFGVSKSLVSNIKVSHLYLTGTKYLLHLDNITGTGNGMTVFPI